jgi:putative two-component system response regulator
MNDSPRNARILIVDDTLQNIQVLGTILKGKNYQINVARNGIEALDMVERARPDLILLDVMMPEMDGFETCRRLKKSPDTRDIPIVFLTAKTETDDVVKGLELGGVDYVFKPFTATELLVRVDTHVSLHQLRQDLEQRVRERTVELRLALEDVEAAHLDTITRLVLAAEYKDEDTATHIRRMSHYAALLARRAQLPESEVDTMLLTSSMHDVGKIGIPDAILLKPGKFDRDEFDIMKQHTTLGAKMLNGSPSRLLQAGKVIALSHHEKWDGSGYPHGLAGKEIPLWGRICAVADVFDALTSARPYKQAFSIEKARNILLEGRGSHFEAKLVDLFLENFDEVAAIQGQYHDE